MAKKSTTEKIMDKTFDAFIVFDNISENIDDYKKPGTVPLYLSLTEEEAIEACFRILYIKHIDHYSLWCELREMKMGIGEDSWPKYVQDVLGGHEKAFLDEFKVIRSSYTYAEIISMIRLCVGATAILGLPSETAGETMAFLDRAELDESTVDSKKPRLLPADKANDPVAASMVDVMGCKDVGEYIGKLSAMAATEFLDASDIWRKALNDNNIPAKIRATYSRALKVAGELLSHSKGSSEEDLKKFREVFGLDEDEAEAEVEAGEEEKEEVKDQKEEAKE